MHSSILGGRGGGGGVGLVSILFLSLINNVNSQATTVAAGIGATIAGTCGWQTKCPANAPCCSEFGFCGTGTSCLSGCNPAGSAAPSFCAPLPVCRSSNYTFTDTSRLQLNGTAYMGDASEFDFTLDKRDNMKTPLIQQGGLAMVLTEAGGGTRISSTRSVLYGNISASIKTVGITGIVTAFIAMSGVKDEIDWETTTNNTNQAQTNYYWEGDVAGYTQGTTVVANNRASEFIVYGIIWTPDVLIWTVNGQTVRTVTRASTLDPKVAGLYHYPQTPSRIQLSVWPAGIAASPPGTIAWSGGLIDWSASSYTLIGFYAAYIRWIAISCYDNPSLTYQAVATNTTSGNTTSKRDLMERAPNDIQSYVWGTNNTAGQIGIFTSNAPTAMNSPFSTGQQMIYTAPVVLPDGGTITTNPDGTKVTSTPTPTPSTAQTAVGAWWSNLPLVAHIGIIVGGVALVLIIFILGCTCYARGQDKKKFAIMKADTAAQNEQIALVEKNAILNGANAGGGGSQISPGWSENHKDEMDYNRRVTPSPRPQFSPRPSLLQQQQSMGGNGGYQDSYMQQQQNLGYQQSMYAQSSYGGSQNGHVGGGNRQMWPDEQGQISYDGRNGSGYGGSYNSHANSSNAHLNPHQQPQYYNNQQPYEREQYGPPSPSLPPSPSHYTPPSQYQSQMQSQYFGDGGHHGR